jgi:hypothetical protein
MKTKSIFTRPKNEATVKLYTDVSEKSLGIEPKLFYPRTSLRKNITRYWAKKLFDTVYFTLPIAVKHF